MIINYGLAFFFSLELNIFHFNKTVSQNVSLHSRNENFIKKRFKYTEKYDYFQLDRMLTLFP